MLYYLKTILLDYPFDITKSDTSLNHIDPKSIKKRWTWNKKKKTYFVAFLNPEVEFKNLKNSKKNVLPELIPAAAGAEKFCAWQIQFYVTNKKFHWLYIKGCDFTRKKNSVGGNF